jgi:hypothetical protein
MCLTLSDQFGRCGDRMPVVGNRHRSTTSAATH